jgi:hypothetical protein
MLVATIKHEYGLELSPYDQLMLAGAARREQKVREEHSAPFGRRSARARPVSNINGYCTLDS